MAMCERCKKCGFFLVARAHCILYNDGVNEEQHCAEGPYDVINTQEELEENYIERHK